MAKPLRSEESGPPKDVQFAHFGLLPEAKQDPKSTATAITLNILIAIAIIIIGARVKKVADNAHKLGDLVYTQIPPKPPPPPPPPPKFKIPPPPKLPDPPKVVVDPPKIKIEVPKVVDTPKPVVVKMETPKPVLAPPTPVKVVAPPAPVVVSLTKPAPASVVNADPHPTAVRLGNPNSPVNPTTGPAVAKVNLAAGMAGMPPNNTGGGPRAVAVTLGSGQQGGTAMKGPMGPVAVAGIPHGTPGATGTGTVAPVAIAVVKPPPPPMPPPSGPTAVAKATAPKVLFRPTPAYTAEAREKHIEGSVMVRVRVTATGAVQVLGVSSGLGYGLDESALKAASAMRFQPAVDASGAPVPWEGVVAVTFQIA